METSKVTIRQMAGRYQKKGNKVLPRNSSTVCNPAYADRITMHPPKIDKNITTDKYVGRQGSINFSNLKNVLIKNGWGVKKIINHLCTVQIIFNQDDYLFQVFILKKQENEWNPDYVDNKENMVIFTEADCGNKWVCGCEDSQGDIVDFTELESVVYQASTLAQKEFFDNLEGQLK